jgi:hypothetical protein
MLNLVSTSDYSGKIRAEARPSGIVPKKARCIAVAILQELGTRRVEKGSCAPRNVLQNVQEVVSEQSNVIPECGVFDTCGKGWNMDVCWH